MMRFAMMRLGLGFSLLSLVWALPCCFSEKKDSSQSVGYRQSEEDGGNDYQHEDGSEVKECWECHDRSRVFGAKGEESGSLLEFYKNANAGLKRVGSLLPGAADAYRFDAPDRGRHADFIVNQDCDLCHPILADATGHGMRTYRNGADCIVCHEEYLSNRSHGAVDGDTPDPFEGGYSCGLSCHPWIGESIFQVGPTGKGYSGTLRPETLMDDPANPHYEIWTEGYRRPEGDESIRLAFIAPGCGGCHSVNDPSHGQQPSCMTCHTWETEAVEDGAHQRHLRYIGDRLADGMVDACGWCHGFSAPDSNLARPACYNCHLSAHAPTDAGGQPQLGP